MIVQLNRAEVIKWAQKNLSNFDSLKFPVNYCVKAGFFVPVTKDLYLQQNVEDNGVTWHIDEVHRLSDQEMRDYNLTCRYRFYGRAIKTPKRYYGTRTLNGGIYVPSEALYPEISVA